jgi:hypothetical protein
MWPLSPMLPAVPAEQLAQFELSEADREYNGEPDDRKGLLEHRWGVGSACFPCLVLYALHCSFFHSLYCPFIVSIGILLFEQPALKRCWPT